MSLTNKGKPQDRLVTLTDSIKSHINGAGEEFVSAQTTAGIVSFESLGDMDKLSVDRSFEEVKQLIKNQLSSVGLESIGDARWRFAQRL